MCVSVGIARNSGSASFGLGVNRVSGHVMGPLALVRALSDQPRAIALSQHFRLVHSIIESRAVSSQISHISRRSELLSDAFQRFSAKFNAQPPPKSRFESRFVTSAIELPLNISLI